MPTSEPSASPSGFSWVVSRKRSPLRSASSTCSRGPATVASALMRSPCSRRRSSSDLLDQRVQLRGRGRRRQAKVSVGVCFIRSCGAIVALQEAVRASAGPSSVASRSLLVAEHADVDLRVAQVGAGLDGGHGHEADPRVLQLAPIASPSTSRMASSTRRISRSSSWPAPVGRRPPIGASAAAARRARARPAWSRRPRARRLP